MSLSACNTSHPDSTKRIEGEANSGNTRQRMEQAIAERILADIHKELPTLQSSEKPAYLAEKKRVFDSSVDLRLTSNRILHEKAILDYLQLQTDLAVYGSGYEPALRRQTSLDWTVQDYRDLVTSELTRIDQTIAVLSQAGPQSFDLAQHAAQQRTDAAYPERSFEGRQAYLDDLADAMMNSQLNWYDTFENYGESALAIYGEEDMEQMFRYSPDGLTINLSNTENLPEFELNALAVFYGFPGQGSFMTGEGRSLKAYIRLPAYTRGWGFYMVETIATRDTQRTIEYLYFSRLLTALALADLNLHTGHWNRETALKELFRTLPYSENRLALMLNEVSLEPGLFVATIAGKAKFSEMHEQCLAEGLGDACHNVFNQRVIDWGPLPFSLLQERLFE